ncbi:HAMP domain-containing protein [Pseudohalioglobus sediminis]|uniref:HAMP domain-containing protein n=1 Tax=Pseudohalioglobus sediminis TaxID=2606449 RepID=A0A5B0X0L7_9GAMM|nr:HD domain-containing phosphohydrolase [Pseudohalioglobus sediminis]KAA1192872.1 HAMP domain-containing protein [Pseudohalioglobus sediminis]
MTPSRTRFKTSIRLTVISVFMFGTVLTAGVALYFQYYFSESMAKLAAAELYAATAGTVATELNGTSRVYANVINLLADNGELALPQSEQELVRTFTGVLQDNPLLYGIYIGREDGSLTQVINRQNVQGHGEYGDLHDGDRWLLISVKEESGARQRRVTYLDADLRSRTSRVEAIAYKATERDWYISALSSNTLEISAPYRFAQSGVMGRTLSRRIKESRAVVGLDLTLGTLSNFLSGQSIAAESGLFLFDDKANILAANRSQTAALAIAGADTGAGLDAAGATGERVSRTLFDIAADASSPSVLDSISIQNEEFVFYAEALKTEDKLFLGILTPVSAIMAPFNERILIAIVGTTIALLLLLPLSWLLAGPIVRPVKQLAKENDKVRRLQFDQVVRIESHIREIDELSASMVDMVDSIKSHEAAQRELIDAVIRLIGQAIDDKSAYTGGHCERVPELAMLLVTAADSSDTPPFSEFKFESPDQWREYRIAAWLHDCGKITTPEHIVDKGSKLEMIYNRIHEVRMRFEVLSRDAEIRFWESLAEQPEKRSELYQALRQEQEALQTDFSFIAECNIGGERLGTEKLQRLKSIAQKTWQRRFDNRLGLSPKEELVYPNTAPPPPVTEHVLADKPEHIVKRESPADFDPALGIDMAVPENLYNHGELYNLSIERGTLTPEDRFKINEHMISTIKMLEDLPFPEELSRVPRYASTHHETLDGRGYPRRLTADQLTIPERILAIADVFEALTAADRPYKKAKTVGAAVSIMHDMVQNNHLDRACFELFLASGVYLEYARRYLSSAQIDEVDVEQYIREEDSIPAV